MAGGFKFKLISAGFEDMFQQWATNDGKGRAQRILNAAQASAPVDSGDYQNSLRVELIHTDRPVWRVVSDVEYAHLVEANNGTLARALDAGGGA